MSSIIYRSETMALLCAMVSKIAAWIYQGANPNTVVFFEGETGTGKTTLVSHMAELAQLKLHVINGAAIDDGLAMDEIFGHGRGAFTGAQRARPGAIEAAGSGILFIDEVTRLSRDVQGALLRAVRERKYRKVGDDKEQEVKCIFVFASCDDIDALVAEGRFLKDLLGRMSMLRLRVPALRDRVWDIPQLAKTFAAEIGEHVTITPDAMDVIQTYEYPFNVAGLQNLVRACALLGSGTITTDVVRRWIATQRSSSSTPRTSAASAVDRRRHEIRSTLLGGHYTALELAEMFDVSRNTIITDVTALDARVVGAGPSTRYTLMISQTSQISQLGDLRDCEIATLTTDPSNTDQRVGEEGDDAA